MLRRSTQHNRTTEAREPDGLDRVADLSPRQRARVVGEIVALRIQPRAGVPTLEVRIDDGTGTLTAIWYGRRRIGGIETGRRVAVEGTVVSVRERLSIINPAYELLLG